VFEKILRKEKLLAAKGKWYPFKRILIRGAKAPLLRKKIPEP
jgi:hypothetical protein